MIYTVISTLEQNRIEQNRDCLIIGQPLSLLPKEIKKYIDNTKNSLVKSERQLAYITLLCSLKEFFDIEKPIIDRTAEGKPFIKDSQVYISLSHSDGAVAVCLSDEGEVGVDLQSEISLEREIRLKERFFKDLNPKSDELSVKYYFCSLDENSAMLRAIDTPANATVSFTSKWAYAESLMKLCGGGFGDISSLTEIKENAMTEIKILDFGKKYSLAISVEK